MEVKLNDPIEQKLLNRKSYDGTVSFEGGIPSRLELKGKVAAKVGAKPEVVIVSDIKAIFGTNTAKFNVRVYDDEKIMNEIEHSSKVKKNTPKEEKTEEAA